MARLDKVVAGMPFFVKFNLKIINCIVCIECIELCTNPQQFFQKPSFYLQVTNSTDLCGLQVKA